MPYSSAPTELRYLSGTTFNKTHTVADNAAWAAGTATSLRIESLDTTGLVQEGIPNPELQTNLSARPANVPGLRMGSLKFNTSVGSANASTTINPVATVCDLVLGGSSSPATTYQDDVEGSSTSTNIKMTSHGQVVGQCGLFGVRGDGDGEGEIRRINVIDSANDYTVYPAIADAPATSVDVWNAQQAYFDASTTQEYLDFKVIKLDDATPHQLSAIGCQVAGLKVVQTGVGELVQFEWEFNVADWDWELVGDKATRETDQTNLSGNAPPFDLSIGQSLITNASGGTRQQFKIANVTFDTGINYLKCPDFAGVNGVGGWTKGPSIASGSFDILSDQDLPGLDADWDAGTAKHIILQWGHTTTNTFGIICQNAYLTDKPNPTEVDGFLAHTVKFHCSNGANVTTALDQAPYLFVWA